jgi:hypothetical protein
MGVLGGLTSETSQNVSRLGTHRSNEWEGGDGNVFVVHAARDIIKTGVKVMFK